MTSSAPPSHAEDAAIVRGALARENEALRRLGERMHCVDRMLYVRNQRSGNWLDSHELEDLGQEVRATIWRRLDTYRDIGSLPAWFYGFCEFHMRNAVRKKHRRPAETELDGTPEHRDAPPPVFFDHVHAGIAQLDEIDQRIVRMKHFDGMTLEAIARALDTKLGTVKSRYFRALNRLRGTLARHAEADE